MRHAGFVPAIAFCIASAIHASPAAAQSAAPDADAQRAHGLRIGGGIEGSLGVGGLLRIGYQFNRIVGVYGEAEVGYMIPVSAFSSFSAVSQFNLTPNWFIVGGAGVVAFFPRTGHVYSDRPCLPDPNSCEPPVVVAMPSAMARVGYEIAIRDAQHRRYGAISIALDGRFAFAVGNTVPVLPMPALMIGYESY